MLISHRDHKEHRALVWIAESAIQIKLLSSYRWRFTPSGVEEWSDFGDLSRFLRGKKAVQLAGRQLPQTLGKATGNEGDIYAKHAQFHC